jgi:hypothetical protein
VKRLFRFITFSLLFTTLFFCTPGKVLAGPNDTCENYLGTTGAVIVRGLSDQGYAEGSTEPLTITFQGLPRNDFFTVQCRRKGCFAGVVCNWDNGSYQNVGTIETDAVGNATLSTEITDGCFTNPDREHQISLYDGNDYCRAETYDVVQENQSYRCVSSEVTVNQTNENGCFEVGDTVNYSFSVTLNGEPAANTSFYIPGIPVRSSAAVATSNTEVTSNSEGVVSGSFTIDPNATNTLYTLGVGDPIRIALYGRNITVNRDGTPFNNNRASSFLICQWSSEEDKNIRGDNRCTDEDRAQEQSGDYNIKAFSLCGQLKNESDAWIACESCREKNGIWTAVGCISANPGQMIATLVKIGINIGGGVALLMILAAGFMFSTSQGQPDKTKEAKEMMQSAIIGLLFIIFSVTILQFIGVEILQIPGFGGA